MWSLRAPTDEQLAAFLAGRLTQPLSYPDVGISDRPETHRAGYDADHNRALLGHGQAAYQAACAALMSWRQFPAPWTRVFPADAPLEQGQTIAMTANALGAWWWNACRVVYVIREPRRFGFAYGTLRDHVESGEERFLVEWLEEDDSVWYDLRAFSRPRYWMVRLGYPLARRLQKRFARESKAAMQQQVAAAATSVRGEGVSC